MKGCRKRGRDKGSRKVLNHGLEREGDWKVREGENEGKIEKRKIEGL